MASISCVVTPERALAVMDLADKHELPIWRVALSLGRLWRAQDQPDAAQQLVSEVYGRFTEGFATADLLDAKELLGN